MLQTRRNLLRLARRSTRVPPRRYESSKSSSDHAGEAHHAPHAEPVNESLGRNFYIALATIPFSLALYKFSTSSSSSSSSDAATQPLFTRLIARWSAWSDDWAARNATHTAMIEQAAHDRNLFHNSPGSRMVDLKFPEVFNTGSPYNVPAGHSANLDGLIEHYVQRNRETDERRERKMRKEERIERERIAEEERKKKEEEEKAGTEG